VSQRGRGRASLDRYRAEVPVRRCLAAFAVALAAVAVLVGCGAHASNATVRTGVDHVVVVVFENQEETTIDKHGDASPFERFADRFADLTNYTAVAHPSLPNYLALVSGSTQGVTEDCTSCGPWSTSIGTSLTDAGKSWGAYAQGYPSSPLYVKKHVPFLYFTGGARHVHPLSSLDNHHLPAYAFVAPNLCSDGHSCPLSSANSFIDRFLPPLLTVPHTAVFVLFDEGTTSIGGGGRIEAFVAGTAVKHHAVFRGHANHYTVLRTVEDIFGLPHLGASRTAAPLTGIWR
jgi:acid phosphatase